ncbi:MAG: hypothetical protein JWN70_3381 [Planctomycetaceae bacterium]|nr:hypothetical protein [Planctomycetaceae bacterium]
MGEPRPPGNIKELKLPTWAIQLRSADLEPIGVLWRVPGVEALSQADGVWLRGSSVDDATTKLLQCLPCMARYEILPDGALRLTGHRVPQGYLPDGAWRPLDQFLNVMLPVASLTLRQHARVPVRLVPSVDVRVPNVLVTDFESWANYARTAPQVRLRHCQFAAASDGRVLIQGTPLPPLAGVRAVSAAGLVVPCGWTWAPAVEASLLAKSWGIEPGDLWLLAPGRTVECIRRDQLVAATRSAVQQTREAIQRV